MRKITILATALAAMLAVLAGCEKKSSASDSEQSAEKVPMTFYAYPQGGERTGMDVDGKTSVWTKDDEIRIFSSEDTEGSPFTLTEGGGTTFGTFEGELVKASSYSAAYPASLASGQDGSIIIFDLPNNQDYAVNSYANNTVPMVSYTTDNQLQFQNTTGLLRLGIKTTAEVTVTKMVLTDKNSSAKLWGEFKVTPADNGLEYVSGGDNTLAMNLGSGVALNSADYTYFFFCLPAGTLAGGFTVDMETANGDVAKIDYTGTDKKTELNVGKPYDAEGVEFVPRPACQKALDAAANWVEIGGQYWLKQNTRCIEYDTKSEAFEASWLTDNTIPTSKSAVYTPYYKATRSGDPEGYGYYYSWAAAVGVENGQTYGTEPFSGNRQGICPNGSHIPTDDEWNALKTFIETTDGKGSDTAGKHLKSNTVDWNGTRDHLDTYGFAALPAGNASGSSVGSVGNNALFCSATPHESNSINAYYRSLSYNNDYLGRGSNRKDNGKSVRCLRD